MKRPTRLQVIPAAAAIILCGVMLSSADFIIRKVPTEPGADLSAGLLAWYDFDEGTGTSVGDSSVNTNDMTTQGSPAWTIGKRSASAMDFSGGDNWATRSQMTNGLSDMTISSWVRYPTQTPGYAFSEYKAGFGTWYLTYSNASRAWGVRIFDSLGGNATSGSPGPYPVSEGPGFDGEWYHAILTYASATSEMALYINGALYHSENMGLGGTLKDTAYDLVMGGLTVTAGSAWADDGTDVEIDNYRCYNRVVSAAERTLLYEEGLHTYSSSQFDIDTHLSRGSLVGAADGSAGLFSAWVKTTIDGNRDIFYAGSGRIQLRQLGSDEFSVTVKDGGGFTQIAMQTLNDQMTTNTWHHILCGWDTSVASRRYIYIDGVDATDSVPTELTGTNIDYTHTEWNVVTASADLTCLMTELYFTNEWMPAADAVRAFNDGGVPKTLGADGSMPTGTQPWIYLKDPYNSFETNYGSGGDFTVNGALLDGGADIP